MATEEKGGPAFARWLVEQRRRLRAEGKVSTQEEIARRAGVSRSMLATIEGMAASDARLVQPSREMVEKIATALGASTYEALETAGYAPRTRPVRAEDFPPTVREIAEFAVDLPREDQELLRGIAIRMRAAREGALRNPRRGVAVR